MNNIDIYKAESTYQPYRKIHLMEFSGAIILLFTRAPQVRFLCLVHLVCGYSSVLSMSHNHTLSAPDSDSEEHSSARGGWPPLSGMRSHSSLTRKRRSASPPASLMSSQKSQKKKHKHLTLLLEEAGLSSSDDSFDQGY